MNGPIHRRCLLIIPVVLVLAVLIGFAVLSGRAKPRDPLAEASKAYSIADWSRAEALARGVLKADATDSQALRLLARCAARQGRDEFAEGVYRRLGTARMEAEDYYLLGRGLLERGQSGPALASLGAARDLEPEHAETLNALSRYWAQTHLMSDAVDAARRLAKQPGWEVRGQVRLATLYSQLNDPGGAAEALGAALARDPNLTEADLDSAAAANLLARSWLQAGRPAKARDSLAQPSGPELDPERRWLLSRAFLQEGKVNEAISALKAAAGFGSGDPLFPEPAPFVGALECARCHEAKFQSQQNSRHARTLLQTADLALLPWPAATISDDDNARVTHQFHRVNERVEVETTVENQVFRAVVEFAMGSRHQGQSFVAREADGAVRELRISRYPDPPEWSRTMEHPAIPRDAAGYLGRPMTAESFRRCLHCHSTNFRAVLEPEGRPEARDHGIGCERCHGPGGLHAAAIASSFPVPAIARPRLASARRVVALCGECHTAPPKTGPNDAGFVRYQASGLVLSRCFTESNENLSCTTCHDPHTDAETQPAYYESRCLNCHSAITASADLTHKGSLSARGSSCRVSPEHGCLACHMPKVKDAVPRSVFTDHYIRVKRQ